MLLQVAVLSVVMASGCVCRTENEGIPDSEWWKTTAFYQIYPRSFMDYDGDGVGDLLGIKSKLEHLVDAGIGAFWISPIYPSPMVDFGYDISNFTDIDPIFGNLDDFDQLVARAKELKLKVILDFVPNHSSDKHEWFEKSVKRLDPYTDYYVWRDRKDTAGTGTPQPPNNWISCFQGSAWEWNAKRGQFYLHQFAVGQPDLNYRNAELRKQMENVLTFWIKRGVEGFRIDVINHIFEDESFADEPPSNNPDVPEGYYDSLDHIFTKNQNEAYDVLQTWRDLLDKYSEETGTDTKVIMTEVYAELDLTTKYYKYGSNVPFNFKFITDARQGSTASELKTIIDNWIENTPANSVANWVVGNHDQHRVASRYGVTRADQMSILCLILPGVAVTYNGDEIGMVDTYLSWNDTVDPAACNTDPDHYEAYTRDPERTPFQWDNSTNAGFSSGESTWLPVNENYVELNLAAQKEEEHSHYHVYQAMTALRKLPILKSGSLTVKVVSNNVLAVARTITGIPPVIVLVNCGETEQTVNVKTAIEVPDQMTVYMSSVASTINPGSKVTTNSLRLPGAATVVLTSQSLYEIINKGSSINDVTARGGGQMMRDEM